MPDSPVYGTGGTPSGTIVFPQGVLLGDGTNNAPTAAQSTHVQTTIGPGVYQRYVTSTVTVPISTTLGITPALSSYAGTVANASAVVGMTARMEPKGFDPGLVLMAAWIVTNGTINYRITNLSAANMVLNGAQFAIYPAQP